MTPPEDLTGLINHTLKELSYDKQQEVYDFAAYLKSRGRHAAAAAPGASIVGVLEGPEDLAAKHDEIYD